MLKGAGGDDRYVVGDVATRYGNDCDLQLATATILITLNSTGAPVHCESMNE